MRVRMWTLASLASTAMLAFLADRAAAQAPPKPAPAPAKPAAVVNGEPISYAEVEAILKRRPPAPTPPTEIQKRQLQLEALALLIDDVLLRQFLRKHAPPADPKEVAKRLSQLEQDLKAQQRTLPDYYRDTGQTEAQLRADIASMLQMSAYVKSRLTDAQIKRYYDDNKDFFDQVTVRVSHILLRVPPTATESERQSARAQLQALRAEIAAGKVAFAEAAKKHSHCPSGAQSGGDIGYIPRKFVVEEAFAKAAFALRVGDVSDVVPTDYGYHLIQVTDRKPGQPTTFDQLKEEVGEVCALEMQQALIAHERKTAKVEVNLP